VINGNGKKSAIASYEDFKPVALEVYDRLNRDFNLDNLVAIYRIRREIGERVERSHFNEWLLEMQANDVLQLLDKSHDRSSFNSPRNSIPGRASSEARELAKLMFNSAHLLLCCEFRLLRQLLNHHWQHRCNLLQKTSALRLWSL
jgi:hypothetical protein